MSDWMNFGLSLAIAAIVMASPASYRSLDLSRLSRRQRYPPMIASLGLAIAIRYSIRRSSGRTFPAAIFRYRAGMQIAGAFITRQQIWILAIVACAMLAFHLLLQYSSIGKAMRATSTNPELRRPAA
jgi:branched-chain amino acid transport system permease protein